MATYLDQLVQDPSFLIGASLLGGQTKDIGRNILGAQEAIAQQNAARQLAEQRQLATDKAQRQSTFNLGSYIGPNGDVNRTALLSGALGAGYDPADIAAMTNLLQKPAASYMNVAPGGSVFNQTTGNVDYQAPFKPPEAPTALRELAGLDTIINMLPPGPQRDMFTARRDQVSGAAAQQDRQTSLEMRQAAQDQAKATSEANRQLREDQQNQNRLMKFSTEMEKSGIPQGEAVLSNIENMLSKYGKGQVPGYGRVQSMLPGFMLPQDAQAMRQAIAPLANITIKNRSGAAVTVPEWQRFQTELGSGAFMPEERLRQGLAMFRQLIEAQKSNYAAGVDQNTLDSYVNNGGVPIKRARAASAPKSKAEYDALPSGTEFIDPNGVKRRKP